MKNYRIFEMQVDPETGARSVVGIHDQEFRNLGGMAMYYQAVISPGAQEASGGYTVDAVEVYEVDGPKIEICKFVKLEHERVLNAQSQLVGFLSLLEADEIVGYEWETDLAQSIQDCVNAFSTVLKAHGIEGY